MIDLLKLCGFQASDLESELPRIEKAFNKIGINTEDIERGKDRLTKYYDIKLQGIRKILKLNMQELVNSILAREDGKTRLVYGFMAPGFNIIGSALVSKSDEVYAQYLCWSFQSVVGGIFDKMVPILEAAEAKWLKGGVVAHCGNVKTVAGLLALDIIPKPDLMVTSGSLCDAAPKTMDLIHQFYNIPVVIHEACQDREFREYPEASKRMIELSVKSLRRLVEKIQKVVGYKISDDLLAEVLEKRSGLVNAILRLNDLIRSSDPLPISPTNESLWAVLASTSLSVNQQSEAIDAINTLYEELQDRVNQGRGVVEKGAPRILALLPNSNVDPRLEYLISELGMALVCTDAGFLVPDAGKPGDPYEAWSMYVQGSLYTSLARRIPLIIEECKRLNINGVLSRLHVGCRANAADAIIMKEALMKELKIPVILLEEEGFDPRFFDQEQYSIQLETFKSML